MYAICKLTQRILLGICFLVTISWSYGQDMPKALLLTGLGTEPKVMDGYPPWIHEFHTDMMSDILQGVVQIDVTSDLSDLNAEKLESYDMVISYSMFLTPSETQLDALYDFISNGKSLFTAHCGILSFLNWDKYQEVMGGIFVGGPSSEPENFRVRTGNMEFWGYGFPFRRPSEHPVSKTVDDFTIGDELYYFQPDNPDFHVIARAENHPVMWWHPVGKGKVMGLTLGHSKQAKRNEGYQQLLVNGVRWLLDFPLIETQRIKPLSTRNDSYPNFMDLREMVHSHDGKGMSLNAKGDRLTSLTLQPGGTIDLRLNGGNGSGDIWVEATNAKGKSTKRKYEITVIQDGQGNIASYHGNVAKASSTEPQNRLFHPDHIIDGDHSTQWASTFEDPSWVEVDLKKSYPIGTIDILWGETYATSYQVDISINGKDWKTIKTVDKGDGGWDEIKSDGGMGRYVRVTGFQRSRNHFGYSMMELEVYAH